MYQLRVEGMSCGACVNGVKRAVQAVDEGAEVEVDLESKTVRVSSQASMGTVRTAIQEAGYPVISGAET